MLVSFWSKWWEQIYLLIWLMAVLRTCCEYDIGFWKLRKLFRSLPVLRPNLHGWYSICENTSFYVTLGCIGFRYDNYATTSGRVTVRATIPESPTPRPGATSLVALRYARTTLCFIGHDIAASDYV